MTTRVTNPNEIKINGTPFRVSGDITLSLASQYPTKSVTGDFNEDSQPWASIHTWEDWRGGPGVDRWKGPEDDNRSWWSSCHVEQRGHLLLPPLASSTTSDPSSVRALAPLGNSDGTSYLYTVPSNGVVVRSTNGTSWGATLYTSPVGSTPISMLNFSLRGTEYLAFAYTTGYAYTTDGTTWTESTVDAGYLAVWDDRLWGVDRTGQVWYTFTVGSGEVNVAKVPVPAGSTYETNLEVGRDAAGEFTLYAYNPLGLFIYDAANDRWIRVIETPHSYAIYFAFNGGQSRMLTWWRDRLFLSVVSDLWEYDPANGTIKGIWPFREDGYPAGRVGKVNYLMGTADHLYVGVNSASGSDYGGIYRWNEVTWANILDATYAASVNFPAMVGHFPYSGYALYFASDPASGDDIKYITLPQHTQAPKQISGYTYASSATHKTPWFDAGQNDVTKTLLEVRVTTQDCDADDTVTVALAYDYAEGSSDTSYVILGPVIVTNGVTIFSIDSNGDAGASGTLSGKDFVAVRVKLTLAGGASTTSPDVSRVSLVYRKKLPPKYQVKCKLDLTKEYARLSPREQRRLLVAAMETTTMIECTYRNDSGGTRNYYGDLVSVTGLEKTGDAEDGTTEITFVEL